MGISSGPIESFFQHMRCLVICAPLDRRRAPARARCRFVPKGRPVAPKQRFRGPSPAARTLAAPIHPFAMPTARPSGSPGYSPRTMAIDLDQLLSGRYAGRRLLRLFQSIIWGRTAARRAPRHALSSSGCWSCAVVLGCRRRPVMRSRSGSRSSLEEPTRRWSYMWGAANQGRMRADRPPSPIWPLTGKVGTAVVGLRPSTDGKRRAPLIRAVRPRHRRSPSGLCAAGRWIDRAPPTWSTTTTTSIAATTVDLVDSMSGRGSTHLNGRGETRRHMQPLLGHGAPTPACALEPLGPQLRSGPSWSARMCGGADGAAACMGQPASSSAKNRRGPTCFGHIGRAPAGSHSLAAGSWGTAGLLRTVDFRIGGVR